SARHTASNPIATRIVALFDEPPEPGVLAAAAARVGAVLGVALGVVAELVTVGVSVADEAESDGVALGEDVLDELGVLGVGVGEGATACTVSVPPVACCPANDKPIGPNPTGTGFTAAVPEFSVTRAVS